MRFMGFLRGVVRPVRTDTMNDDVHGVGAGERARRDIDLAGDVQ